ncbi:amidase signature enzyme [Melanomma pulvis-pyrius CBS 109.77]|uniref:Amidase signature enzyme n=1 Tax=Melanomma pulvis-pyrius CBS 109.77 TaxID=1314802 RepID=A0A6A6XT54_9PLEO|nr:amidase signature enzyme [Melanomma pulvis-pyrius CBS 109.77]
MASDKKTFNLLTSSATDVYQLFERNELSAASLAEQVFQQVDRHNTDGKHLRAIIAIAPRKQVLERARELDQERKNGRVRSRLHGIPFIVKDSIATDSSLGMSTTAGSWALKESKPAKNAPVVEKLLEAGMILIGKSSLSTPTGSSTGSAVGVSAGFALLSLGLETDGSILSPASRAALYAMKPTMESVSLEGIISVTKSLDAVGGMARSPADLAALTELIQQTTTGDLNPRYHEVLKGDWSGIRLGFLNETVWQLPHFLCEPNDDALKQMRSEYHQAMDKVAEHGVHVQYPVELPTGDEIWPYTGDIIKYEFQICINNYLQNLASSEVHNLGELVEWNRAHADKELPEEYPSQSSLENSLNNTITADENAKRVKIVRELGGPNGVDKVLQQYNLDAIASLSDSPLSSVATASGYPVATMPLGILQLNGRPFGISMIAGKNQEHKLFQIMSAWETLYTRQPPPDLVRESSKM